MVGKPQTTQKRASGKRARLVTGGRLLVREALTEREVDLSYPSQTLLSAKTVDAAKTYKTTKATSED